MSRLGWGLIAASSLRCAPSTSFDRDFVSTGLRDRAGAMLPLDAAAAAGTEVVLPPQVALNDGLTADEAVTVALWNNALFHADLAELGVARADLVEAALLPNPVLSLVFPGNSKAREGTLTVPIQLLQRPTRIAIATANAERIAQSLVSTGLGLVRDVRVAHADLGYSAARVALRSRQSALAAEFASVATMQRMAGQISDLEAQRIEAEALAANADMEDAARQAAAARRRLLGLLGVAELASIVPVPTALPEEPPPLHELIDLALASRPDLRAAELAVEAAAESARWERQQTYDFLALFDLDEEEGGELDTGPGFEFALPVFDRNQGGRERATARLEQAALRYIATQRSIALDVAANYEAHASARAAAMAWSDAVIPSLEGTLQDTRRAFELGSIAELTVLQAEQRLLVAQLASAASRFELERAAAELAHSVGQKVESAAEANQ
jgi:outer membrane protein, heavy metal efflux system